MDPMAGADLDIRGIQEEVLLLRMRFALLSLGLICRVCNCRSSSKVHAEAHHERSDGHYDVLDARAHHATMMPFHAVPFSALSAERCRTMWMHTARVKAIARP